MPLIRRTQSATAFLKAAVVYYASLGVKVARVMTDNGSAYRSFAFAQACRRLQIKHLRTKPYAENQRKSRTFHSDGAARMGLRKGGNIGGYASDNMLLKTNARLITLEFLEREY